MRRAAGGDNVAGDGACASNAAALNGERKCAARRGVEEAVALRVVDDVSRRAGKRRGRSQCNRAGGDGGGVVERAAEQADGGERSGGAADVVTIMLSVPPASVSVVLRSPVVLASMMSVLMFAVPPLMMKLPVAGPPAVLVRLARKN